MNKSKNLWDKARRLKQIKTFSEITHHRSHKMKWGPDWMWIGYMNSFDDNNNGGGGNGSGCLSVVLIIGAVIGVLWLLGR